jgi:hypothetical protein
MGEYDAPLCARRGACWLGGMSTGHVSYASESDRHSHQPSETDDDSFHETWYLAWYDRRSDAVGFHHVGQYRKTGVADVWSWLALGGRTVAHYENLKLPLAAGDISDFELGGVVVKTVDDLVQQVNVSHGDVSSAVEYRAFSQPFSFSMDTGGVGYGAGHMESMGRVSGSICLPDEIVEVDGWGYHDHSWGARDYGAVVSQRWVYGVFGTDLFFSVMSFVLPSGGTMHRGFVFDQGEFHGVEELTYGLQVATDGYSPESCQLTIWAAGGRGYEASAQVRLSETSRHHGSYFQTDGFGPVKLGGRLGTGQVHIRERAVPPPFVDPRTRR